MSVSDGDIIFACKQKFTPPSPDRVAEEIARSLFISTDAIVECVAERVVSDLASRGLVDQIAFAVAEKLSLRSPAQGMYSAEDFKEWLKWLRNYGMQAQPYVAIDHPRYNIAAWKAAQPPSANDPPTETKLVHHRTDLPSFPLFDLMSREHGLTLIESELWEIIRTCKAIDGEPTPDSLRQLAEWFDDPKNPRVFVEKLGKSAGYLQRLIADALAAQLAGKEKQLDEGGKP